MSGEELGHAVATLSARLPSFGDPADEAGMLKLLRLLYSVGRRDLPLGRLFEGHVDALQIVTRYGTAEQARAAGTDAGAGGIFGVWNADLPGDPLRSKDGALFGGKSFASGAGILTHGIVTVDGEGGRQLLLLDLARTPPAIDRSWWNTIGMQRSETHIVRWSGEMTGAEAPIGVSGDYVRDPWFRGGALRFAAVQAGGIAALVDRTRDHLVETGRAGDPHQSGRLAALYAAAQAAAAAVRTAAEGWFGMPEAQLALVAAARAAVYAEGDRALALAQQAVGLQGMFVEHPLAATIADLTVYLRQPMPDAQRMATGAAVASGLLAPRL